MHTLRDGEHYSLSVISYASDAIRLGMRNANFKSAHIRRFIAMHNIFGMLHIFYRFQKRVEENRKFIGNYIYYRKHNHGHFEAWCMAKNTL